jgi:hypothetical protein
MVVCTLSPFIFELHYDFFFLIKIMKCTCKAYFLIQGYSANLYGPVLGSNMATTLYAVFTVACFVAPAIVNVIGTRLSMFIGILCYAGHM